MRHRWGVLGGAVATALVAAWLFVSPALASGGSATSARGSDLKVTIATNGTLRLGIVIASTWASYRGVKESALEVGYQRLQSLTQQLASLAQQSIVTLLGKTFTTANDPAIRALLQTPSPTTRSGALTVLQQFTAAEDPNSLQVELYDANRSLALTLPENATPEQQATAQAAAKS